MNEIKQWIEDPQRDYTVGVALFAKYSKNKAMANNFARGTARFWMGKLEYEMGKLAKQYTGREMGQDVSKKMSKMEVKTSEFCFSIFLDREKLKSQTRQHPI